MRAVCARALSLYRPRDGSVGRVRMRSAGGVDSDPATGATYANLSCDAYSYVTTKLSYTTEPARRAGRGERVRSSAAPAVSARPTGRTTRRDAGALRPTRPAARAAPAGTPLTSQRHAYRRISPSRHARARAPVVAPVATRCCCRRRHAAPRDRRHHHMALTGIARLTHTHTPTDTHQRTAHQRTAHQRTATERERQPNACPSTHRRIHHQPTHSHPPYIIRHPPSTHSHPPYIHLGPRASQLMTIGARLRRHAHRRQLASGDHKRERIGRARNILHRLLGRFRHGAVH